MAGILGNITRRTFSTTKVLGSLADEVYLPVKYGKHRNSNSKLWKNIFLFVCIPTTAVFTYINVICADPPERPEFKPYDYLRIRNKKYPWGDGNRTLFHNPHVNPLPEGYEDELEGHGKH